MNINTQQLSLEIANQTILKNINLSFKQGEITCIVGPSGGGKSSLLRSLNRIDSDKNYSYSGDITLGTSSIFSKEYSLEQLRKHIGMVFQKPCVFPFSISKNILFGVKHHQRMTATQAEQLVVAKLKQVALYDEVSDRLDQSALELSIGQQQRLCLARTLAVDPQVLLLDEPTSALDPYSTSALENFVLDFKKQGTVVFVTHNIAQAKRIADHVVFLCNGEVIESGSTQHMFGCSATAQTQQYLNTETCDC